jgi:hypothetical protein
VTPVVPSARNRLLLRGLLHSGPRAATSSCHYCGAPAFGPVCAEHRDLPQVDPYVNPDPAASWSTLPAGSENGGR